MRKSALLALALLSGTSLSCGGRSPTAVPPTPVADGQLEVFVQWQGQGIAGQSLLIVELGLEKRTDAAGIAVFTLPAGSYTMRAFVNGGPTHPIYEAVTVRPAQRERVEITNCLPCVGPG